MWRRQPHLIAPDLVRPSSLSPGSTLTEPAKTRELRPALERSRAQVQAGSTLNRLARPGAKQAAELRIAKRARKSAVCRPSPSRENRSTISKATSPSTAAASSPRFSILRIWRIAHRLPAGGADPLALTPSGTMPDPRPARPRARPPRTRHHGLRHAAAAHRLAAAASLEMLLRTTAGSPRPDPPSCWLTNPTYGTPER